MSDALILRQTVDVDSILHCFKPRTNTFVDCLINFLSISLNVRISNNDMSSVIELSKKYLPINQSEALERLNTDSKIINMDNIKKCFKECMNGYPQQTLAIITENIIEIMITKNAVFSLLELATPEEVFTKRNYIPVDIMQQYFQQHHFSLKSLLNKLKLKSSRQCNYCKFLVHTRTNTHVASIPVSRPDIGCMNESNIIESLTCSDRKSVMIGHLHFLKNEASVRSAIDNWASSKSIDIFILIADMSNRESIERVNFVRCCVDHIRF